MIIKINHDDHDDDGIDLISRALGKGYYSRKGLLMMASIYTHHFWPPKKSCLAQHDFPQNWKRFEEGLLAFLVVIVSPTVLRGDLNFQNIITDDDDN